MVTPKSVYSELMLLHKVYQIDYREYITEFSIKTDCERLRWEMFLHSRNYWNTMVVFVMSVWPVYETIVYKS